MTDVRLTSITVNARSIGVQDAYVMQHSGFNNKVQVNRSVGINKPLGKLQSQLGDLLIVFQKKVAQFTSWLIKTTNNGVSIYHSINDIIIRCVAPSLGTCNTP